MKIRKTKYDYYNEVSELLSVIHAMTWRNATVQEAEQIRDAARAAIKRLRKGKKYNKRSKKIGVSERSLKYFAAREKANMAGLGKDGYKQFINQTPAETQNPPQVRSGSVV